MGSDDLFKKRKSGRTNRYSKQLETRSDRWLFVSEGTKTEPNYINNLLDYANSKSSKEIIYKAEGVGKNTESLVLSVDDFIGQVQNKSNKPMIPYSRIYVIFDKDSFPKNQFNNAITIAQNKGYIPLWSNECIELWFILHFRYLQSNINREQYFKKLTKLIKEKYDKSDNIFDKLIPDDNIKTAVKYAKKLYEHCKDLTSYSDFAPCTKMYLLIEDIENYLEIKF